MSGAGESHQGFGFGRGPILMGLLGLQLMLLAFFIVLVSMSTFDQQRVDSVLGSIQQHFTGLSVPGEGTDEQSRADSIALDALREEVAGVLATALQLDRVQRVGDGAVEIDVADDKLFANGTAQVLPGSEALFRQVIAALDRRPNGFRYEIDVLVGRDATTGTPTLEIAQAGALARAMIDAGAEPASMASGLQPGMPGRVRLVLRLMAGARPGNLFSTAPGGAAAGAP